MDSGRFTLVFFLAISCIPSTIQLCSEGDIRLSDGATKREGRVEICYSGAWGTVCDTGWGHGNTRVVCRQLGYPEGSGLRSFEDTHYGVGNGLVLLDGVQCTGTESSLLECEHNGPGSHQCLHSDDVGVVCPPCAEQAVHLVGGLVPTEGRIELCLNETWNSICDTSWDHKDAFVVCRELDFPATDAIANSNAHFGEHGTPGITEVLCYGNESHLADCHSSVTTSCQSSNSAGVTCLGETVSGSCIEGTVQLSDGRDENEGRVEICSNGVWGTICDGGRWDSNDAAVVCRQLGYTNARVFAFKYNTNDDHFGRGTGPILYRAMTCNGQEMSLAECSSFNPTPESCDHASDVGVRCEYVNTSVNANCTARDVRLTGGQSSAEGHVEICVNSVWGSVCDDSWEDNDAAVVCQELGFQGNGATAYSSAHFGEGNGPYHLDNVKCRGNEESILDCMHDAIDLHSCGTGEEAGVSCDDAYPCNVGDIRLVNGYTIYEGRVEVCLDGSWGTICDETITGKERLVCRQLFGEEIEGTHICCNRFGDTTGDATGGTIVSALDCDENTDSKISECAYGLVSDFGSSTCQHNKDAGVRCYVETNCTDGDVRLVDGQTNTEGRVEMCRGYIWGAITDSDWGFDEARVTCRQLGHPSSWAIPLDGSYFGRGNSPIRFHNVNCNGNEASILECSYSFVPILSVDYNQSPIAGVICQGNTSFQPECSTGAIRIAGEGRVEICVNEYWGTICDDNWSQMEAVVACRQASLPSSGAIPLRGSSIGGEGSGPIRSEITCTGREEELTECIGGVIGATNCHHRKDAGVRCQAAEYYSVSVTVSPEGLFYIGSTVMLHCSVEPDDVLSMNFMYKWKTSVPGMDIAVADSSTPDVAISIPMGHPSEGEYYCHVYSEDALVGVGSTTLQVQAVLTTLGATRIELTPYQFVSLSAVITSKEASAHLRALTWYHNGIKLQPSDRLSLSDDNTTITISGTTEGDVGIYEVKFDGLSVYPYSKRCEAEVVGLLRHYPLFKPLIFDLYSMDEYDTEVHAGVVPEEYLTSVIHFESDQTTVPFTTSSQQISLQIGGQLVRHEHDTVSTIWHFNGGSSLPPATSLGLLQKPVNDIYQKMEIVYPNIFDSGTYEASLVVEPYVHFVSYLACPPAYSGFIEREVGVSHVILSKARAKLQYYETPITRFEADKVTITHMDDATLVCSASGGYPPVSTLSVRKGDTAVTTTMQTLSLPLSTFVNNPFGQFSCLVNNSNVVMEKFILIKERGVLQLELDVGKNEDCSKWDHSTLEQTTQEIESSLSKTIQDLCTCDFNITNLRGSDTICSSATLKFTTTLEYSNTIGDTTATTVILLIIDWVTRVPAYASVTAGGKERSIISAKACNSTMSCDSDPPDSVGLDQESSNSCSETVIAGVFLGGFSGGILLATIAAVVVICTMRKKQQRFFVSPIVDGTLPKVSDVECRYSNPDNIKKEPSNGEATYENMD